MEYAEPATHPPAPDAHAAPRPRGAGRPLPDELRARMERSFQADFTTVRVHEDGAAEATGALAYARGDDIHVRAGLLDEGLRGEEIVGHELAHVVQQRQGRAPATQPAGFGGAFAIDAGLEAEADALGKRAARGEQVATAPAPATAARADGPAQPAIGFELELQVITSKRTVGLPDVTLDDLRGSTPGGYERRFVGKRDPWDWYPGAKYPASERVILPTGQDPGTPGRWVKQVTRRADPSSPEGEFFDPNIGKTPFYDDGMVQAVVDHGNGLSGMMEAYGHGNYTSIIELVTQHRDEFDAPDTFLAPIRKAHALAEKINSQVVQTGKRQPASAVLGAGDPIFLGIDLAPGENQWQHVNASMQATFAVRLDRLGDFMATRAKQRGGRTSDVYGGALTAMSHLAAYLETIGITRDAAPKLWGYLELVCLYLVAGGNPEGVKLDKNYMPILIRDRFDTVAGSSIPPLEWARLPHDVTELAGHILAATKRDGGENLLREIPSANAGAWLIAALTRALDPQWQNWGLARQVAPEEVGPSGHRTRAPVMEEREAVFPHSGNTVKPADWERLATDYQEQLIGHNKPSLSEEYGTPSSGPSIIVGSSSKVERQPIEGTGKEGNVVFLGDGTPVKIIWTNGKGLYIVLIDNVGKQKKTGQELFL